MATRRRRGSVGRGWFSIAIAVGLLQLLASTNLCEASFRSRSDATVTSLNTRQGETSRRRLLFFGGGQDKEMPSKSERDSGTIAGNETELSPSKLRFSLATPFRLMNEVRDEISRDTASQCEENEVSIAGDGLGPSGFQVRSGASQVVEKRPLDHTSGTAEPSLPDPYFPGKGDEDSTAPEVTSVKTDALKRTWASAWTTQSLVEDPYAAAVPPASTPTKLESGNKGPGACQIGGKSDGEATSEGVDSIESNAIGANDDGKSELAPGDDSSPQSPLTKESGDDVFVSSGLWGPIDSVVSLGLASTFPSLRLSCALRSTRKATARVTGLHGLLSGKPHQSSPLSPKPANQREEGKNDAIYEGQGMGPQGSDLKSTNKEIPRRWNILSFRRNRKVDSTSGSASREELKKRKALREQEEQEEAQRKERVKEIDQLIAESQQRVQQLLCEKDVLQRRPNPFFNYTTLPFNSEAAPTGGDEDDSKTKGGETSRRFSFPPDDLVDEYLEFLFSGQGLMKMNHTSLWQDSEGIEDEDFGSIGDDVFTPSVDAHKLYHNPDLFRTDSGSDGKSTKIRNGGGGSWLLRQTLGKGPSLGEVVGEAVETAAYKVICKSVMSGLARSLAVLHGISVMKHADIRLSLDQGPDLPKVRDDFVGATAANYAQETIMRVMRQKAQNRNLQSGGRTSTAQQEAVTEMLLSHVQISAPLLKLFPLAWQRAFLGNIITLVTKVMSDFFEGVQFQVLGHSLSFAFKPTTEEDMMKHFSQSGAGFNQRRSNAKAFEAAVLATAEDISEKLRFLDRWHERALGSGVLRTQIANLIARVVLTLTDDVLCAARMDLWSAQAGGPKVVAGLEYRTKGG